MFNLHSFNTVRRKEIPKNNTHKNLIVKNSNKPNTFPQISKIIQFAFEIYSDHRCLNAKITAWGSTL